MDDDMDDDLTSSSPPPLPMSDGVAETLDGEVLTQEEIQEMGPELRLESEVGNALDDDKDAENKRVLKKFALEATDEPSWHTRNVLSSEVLESVLAEFPSIQMDFSDMRVLEYLSRSAEELVTDAIEDLLRAVRSKSSGHTPLTVTKADVARYVASKVPTGLARVRKSQKVE